MFFRMSETLGRAELNVMTKGILVLLRVVLGLSVRSVSLLRDLALEMWFWMVLVL